MSRRTTYATLNNWTPKRAHNFAMLRVERIKHLLVEIGSVYGDVDEGVVSVCDGLMYDGFDELVELLNEALSEGRAL